MSTTDQPAEGSTHHGHHHYEREGEYPDRDVTEATPEEEVGEYTDTDVVEPRPKHPQDEGSFADHDVVSDHRHPVAEGSYVDAEIDDEDVEANQEARAHEHHGEPDDIHNPGAGHANPSTDPI